MARILVIDDDESVREVFSELLERDGHEVVAIPNAEGMSAAHREAALDLVVTDILMPERDGLEAICELRHYAPGVKIIAVSGGRMVGPALYLDAAFALGADRTFVKPVKGEDLLTAVHELLGDGVSQA